MCINSEGGGKVVITAGAGNPEVITGWTGIAAKYCGGSRNVGPMSCGGTGCRAGCNGEFAEICVCD